MCTKHSDAFMTFGIGAKCFCLSARREEAQREMMMMMMMIMRHKGVKFEEKKRGGKENKVKWGKKKMVVCGLIFTAEQSVDVCPHRRGAFHCLHPPPARLVNLFERCLTLVNAAPLIFCPHEFSV